MSKDLWTSFSPQQMRVMTEIRVKGFWRTPKASGLFPSHKSIGYTNTINSLERKGLIQHRGKQGGYEYTQKYIDYLDIKKVTP
jgi:hypothetical protein